MSVIDLKDKAAFCFDALKLRQWHSGSVWDVMAQYKIEPPSDYLKEISKGIDKISFDQIFEMVLGDHANECVKITKRGNVGNQLFKEG